jgi:hypothetical protein
VGEVSRTIFRYRFPIGDEITPQLSAGSVPPLDINRLRTETEFVIPLNTALVENDMQWLPGLFGHNSSYGRNNMVAFVANAYRYESWVGLPKSGILLRSLKLVSLKAINSAMRVQRQ